MNQLKRQLKETFATVFSFYLKASNFHWNVEGSDFFQYHKLFEEIYSNSYNSIDPLAEHLRVLGTYVPASHQRLSQLTKIEDALEPLTALAMIEQLDRDNNIVIESLQQSFDQAQQQNQQGLMNFLPDRISQHQTWWWFLRSTQKKD